MKLAIFLIAGIIFGCTNPIVNGVAEAVYQALDCEKICSNRDVFDVTECNTELLLMLPEKRFVKGNNCVDRCEAISGLVNVFRVENAESCQDLMEDYE